MPRLEPPAPTPARGSDPHILPLPVQLWRIWLLWLLAQVLATAAAGGLCFGAGIAVERRVLTRRRAGTAAASTGTAALLDLSEHGKP